MTRNARDYVRDQYFDDGDKMVEFIDVFANR
jgi:hypothetical protein